jgi:hypothetical protein
MFSHSFYPSVLRTFTNKTSWHDTHTHTHTHTFFQFCQHSLINHQILAWHIPSVLKYCQHSPSNVYNWNVLVRKNKTCNVRTYLILRRVRILALLKACSSAATVLEQVLQRNEEDTATNATVSSITSYVTAITYTTICINSYVYMNIFLNYPSRKTQLNLVLSKSVSINCNYYVAS